MVDSTYTEGRTTELHDFIELGVAVGLPSKWVRASAVEAIIPLIHTETDQEVGAEVIVSGNIVETTDCSQAVKEKLIAIGRPKYVGPIHFEDPEGNPL